MGRLDDASKKMKFDCDGLLKKDEKVIGNLEKLRGLKFGNEDLKVFEDQHAGIGGKKNYSKQFKLENSLELRQRKSNIDNWSKAEMIEYIRVCERERGNAISKKKSNFVKILQEKGLKRGEQLDQIFERLDWTIPVDHKPKNSKRSHARDRANFSGESSKRFNSTSSAKIPEKGNKNSSRKSAVGVSGEDPFDSKKLKGKGSIKFVKQQPSKGKKNQFSSHDKSANDMDEDIDWGSQSGKNFGKSGEISESFDDKFENASEGSMNEEINFENSKFGNDIEEDIPEDFDSGVNINNKSDDYGWSGLVSNRSKSKEKTPKISAKTETTKPQPQTQIQDSIKDEFHQASRSKRDMTSHINTKDARDSGNLERSSRGIERSYRSVMKKEDRDGGRDRDRSIERQTTVRLED